MAEESGIAEGEDTGSAIVGKKTGEESSLSTWAGPYVTDTLAEGAAAAEMPYEAWTGPLTAGESDLQTDAFTGLAGLTVPTDNMGIFTPTSWTQADQEAYMNPYLTGVTANTINDILREAEIKRMENAARMTAAGSYGGGRQAILEGAFDEALLKNVGDVTQEGYATAFDKALAQFNLEQGEAEAAQQYANKYGLGLIDKQAELGAVQRGIEGEGIAADIKQFEEERDYPLKTAQYKKSLTEGLPLETQQYTYAEPSELSNILSGSGGLMKLYDMIFGTSGTTGEEALGGLSESQQSEIIELINAIVKPKTESDAS